MQSVQWLLVASASIKIRRLVCGSGLPADAPPVVLLDADIRAEGSYEA